MRTERRAIKAWSWILGAILIWESAIPTFAAQTVSTYEEYRAGGREADMDEYVTIAISTEDDLMQLARDCQLDVWSADKLVILENDIRLERHADLMIPSFGGIFEGNGHKISGLRLTAAGSAIGLFRYVQKGGKVNHLEVQGRVEPEGARGSVGGVVGVNYGILSDLSFSGEVRGDAEVGGIVGSNMPGGEIRGCQSDAVVLGNHSTGGIVGSNGGIVSRCQNSGEVNTFSVEVRYDLDEITVERLEDINSTANVTAHTDTGGIAGISFGKIYGCGNSGTVGYVHVGYNVGGIAGRLSQGYLSGCVNEGHVLGRKDVGGIAGQMEPFLEVEYLTDKLQELDRETDKMFDLIDAAHEDLSGYNSRTADALQSMTGHLEAARAAGSGFMSEAEELWYIYNQELGAVGRDLRGAVEEEDFGASGEPESDGDADAPEEDRENDGDGDAGAPEEDREIGGDGDGSGKYPEINLDNVVGREELESYQAALKKFGRDTGEHLQVMSDAAGARSGSLSDNLSEFNEELRMVSEDMDTLTKLLDAQGESMDAHADAVYQQAKVLRDLAQGIRDDLFAYEGIVVEDASDESESETYTYYDTADFKQGKIEGCRNEATVEADTVAGGIVGQIAIEYDLDPEDDLNYTGEESFHIERKVKAVVRESLNRGEVIGKRDYVGGIVGKADFGAIISCESYGGVESTGGSKVGGVAGCSRYAVRNCYSMGRVAGKNQVGGVVGKGCDVLYSYAYNELEVSGECGGAIAGTLEDEGALFGNYYVENDRGGVDGIGYQDGATPLSYEEFSSLQGVPAAFSRFQVAFRVDGRDLAVVECGYGEGVAEELIPDIPQREGFYGVWPDVDLDRITGNEVVSAEYARWMGSLEGEERDARGRSLVLVEGEFLPGAKLRILAQDDATRIVITQPAFSKGRIREEYEDYLQPVTVRVLSDDADEARVEVWENGGFAPVDTRVMGSYVVFSMAAPGVYRVTTLQNHDMINPWIAAGVLAVAALLGIGRAAWARRRRRSWKTMESGADGTDGTDATDATDGTDTSGSV